MEARLSAIQRGLLLLLAASLVVAVMARPEPENRRLVRALDEVSSFRAAFDQKAAEQQLRQQAAGQGALSLSALDEAGRTKGGPKFKASPTAQPVRALANASLTTLAEITAQGRPDSTLTIGVADLQALGASLVWRLARTQRTGAFTVESVELLPSQVTRADVSLEREVGELRTASLDARVALEEAEARIGILEYRVEAQSERRSKSLFKSRLALEEARVTLQQKTQARTDAQSRYDQAAQRAERPRTIKNAQGNAQLPEAAIARVKLAYGAEASTLDVPIALTMRQVKVAPLRVTSFPAVRAASLWEAVKDKPPEGAIAAIRGRFNWHFQRIELLGLQLDGSRVLELLPCILPLLMWLLLRRIRRAEISYSPFGAQVPRSLPLVGFKSRFLEFLAIIVMPLLAIFSAAASLVLNDRIPIVPALAGVACVTLGVFAFAEVRELRDHTQSIVRHSYPPTVSE